MDIALEAQSSSIELVLPTGATADLDSIDAHASSGALVVSVGPGVTFRIHGEIKSSNVRARIISWRSAKRAAAGRRSRPAPHHDADRRFVHA